MSLNNIPIHVENLADSESSSMAEAVVNEIAQLMRAYLNNKQPAVIDIKSLPFVRTDYEQLKLLLGKGEVTASAQLSGETEIYETAYAGVWWIIHRNIDNKILAEHIEITEIPSVLSSHIEDMKQALVRLENSD